MDVAEILSRANDGDAEAGAALFPLVYDELRRIAEAKMRQERPGHSLQATALVHETYLRLMQGHAQLPQWEDLGHFFGSAAEAMRRILIDQARRRATRKRGGHLVRECLDAGGLSSPLSDAENPDLLLALEDALQALAGEDPTAFELVRLRFFAGLTIPQAAACLGISDRTANRTWQYARAWLYRHMSTS